MMREGTAAEFSRLRNLPGVEINHYPDKKVGIVRVKYLGREIATKQTHYNRGKITMEYFHVENDVAGMPAGKEDLSAWYTS